MGVGMIVVGVEGGRRGEERGQREAKGAEGGGGRRARLVLPRRPSARRQEVFHRDEVGHEVRVAAVRTAAATAHVIHHLVKIGVTVRIRVEVRVEGLGLVRVRVRAPRGKGRRSTGLRVAALELFEADLAVLVVEL